MTADPHGGALLRVRDLQTCFSDRRGVIARLLRRKSGEVRAVDGVSFDVVGETLGLVGESGAGKSTLARTALDLVPATGGSAALDGRELVGLGRREWRPLRRRIQMIFQDPGSSLSPRIRVSFLLREPYVINKVPLDQQASVDELLDMVGLSAEQADKYPHELSGGQARRVSIARALALHPEVLFAGTCEGRAKKSSHPTGFGLMISASPCRSMKTSRPEERNSASRRTAWLRPFMRSFAVCGRAHPLGPTIYTTRLPNRNFTCIRPAGSGGRGRVGSRHSRRRRSRLRLRSSVTPAMRPRLWRGARRPRAPAAARLRSGSAARTNLDVVTIRDATPHQLTQEGAASIVSTISGALRITLPKAQSAFLWGPRKTGKTTFLRAAFPLSLSYDVLETDLFFELVKRPSLLRERLLAADPRRLEEPIIIDEVQKAPQLLDEIHWLIENKGLRFVLCGSSARKLVRGKANLLGGRARRYEMHPLVSAEVADLDLLRALDRGLIPAHYLQDGYRKSLQAYVGDYLKEEVFAEGLTRNIPAFSRFFEAMGYSHGELTNYASTTRSSSIRCWARCSRRTRSGRTAT